MATVGELTHYRVTFKDKAFFAHGEFFKPGNVYKVTPDIYNGTVEIGGQNVAFSSLCDTSEEVHRPEIVTS